MDKTDILLIQLLMQNSRRPYRELAEILHLSINAVHKRIQELIKIGILRNFTTKINLSVFETSIVPVWIWGKSEGKSLDEIIAKLGKDSSTYWVSVASGNVFYLGAYLQDISKLDPYLDFVKKQGQILDPTVAIFCLPVHTPSLTSRKQILSSLDYQIIYALHKNSRRSLTEVSKELGITAKTIQRRLSKMVKERSIELSVEFYPDTSNDILAIFHLSLKTSVDKSGVASLLLKKYSPNIFYFIAISNLPTLCLCFVLTNTLKQMDDIRQSFENEGIFESITLNLLQTGNIFETWRDDFLRKKGSPPK